MSIRPLLKEIWTGNARCRTKAGKGLPVVCGRQPADVRNGKCRRDRDGGKGGEQQRRRQLATAKGRENHKKRCSRLHTKSIAAPRRHSCRSSCGGRNRCHQPSTLLAEIDFDAPKMTTPAPWNDPKRLLSNLGAILDYKLWTTKWLITSLVNPSYFSPVRRSGRQIIGHKKIRTQGTYYI